MATVLANYGLDLARLYHTQPRPEILALIPPGARRLLDVGCGAGTLGATVKARQDCYYTGIENNPGAAKKAHKAIDEVIEINVEDISFNGTIKNYDCIIFADVLEHLKDPLATLQNITKDLEPNTTIIVSLPNIAHPRIVRELASGLFRYVNAGILDKTHLRFFTDISAQQMFASARLRVISVTPHPSSANPIQFIYVLKKLPATPAAPRLTILIPANNNLSMLKGCINSIRRSSLRDKIILCLDNGSTDGTISWLRDQEDVLSIRAGSNLGFCIGNNLMLPCVTTPYFLFSNVDTLYPHKSLAGLLEAADDLRPFAGVGPSGPNTSGSQSCKPLAFSNFDELDRANLERNKRSIFTITRTHRLVFFSTLFPSTAIKDIGLLDEIFSPGNFEDDDYCIRAIKQGYSLYHVPYVYVHHYGGAVLKRNLKQYRALLDKNRHIFLRKWGSRLKQILQNYYSPE